MAMLQKDNRWSANKWGTSKWGASNMDPSLVYSLEVDWNNDGIFDGTNEARRLLAYSGSRGRKNMLKPDGSGFQQMAVGQFTFVLDNYDERYSPWNTSSPLYPNISYGRDVRFRVRGSAGGSTVYPVFYGIIQDIMPEFKGDGSEPRVRLVVQDAWTFLRNNSARVQVQSTISTDTAIQDILNALSWPTRWGKSLDISSDVMSYFWSSGAHSAGDDLQDLANAGYGMFFISAAGKAAYRTRGDVPAAALSLNESDVLRDVSPSQPWLNSRNLVYFTANPMTSASPQVVWKLSGTTPSIQPAASFSFTAPYTYNNAPCAAQSVGTPVAGTDWKVNSQANGLGTDLTGSCVLTFVDNGDNAFMGITNNSGSLGYVVLAQINGTPVYTLNQFKVSYPSNPTTVSQPRQFLQDIKWQQDANILASLATVMGPFFATASPMVVVKMRLRPDIQFIPDIWDIVTFTSPTLGINGNSFRVAGIAHDASAEGCQDVITSLYLEPYAATTAGAMYDTGVYDTGAYGW